MSKDKLKPKNTKPRMTILRVMKYRDCPVYIRKYNEDIFTYDLIYKDQLYSSYMVFTPKKGFSKLTKQEQEKASSLLWAGAVATIDMKLGPVDTKESKTKEKLAKVFLNTTKPN